MLFCRLATIYLLSDRMLLQKGINSSSFFFALAFPVERISGAEDSGITIYVTNLQKFQIVLVAAYHEVDNLQLS